jgi:hypothetical protein
VTVKGAERSKRGRMCYVKSLNPSFQEQGHMENPKDSLSWERFHEDGQGPTGKACWGKELL